MSIANFTSLSGLSLAKKSIDHLQNVIANSRNPDYIRTELVHTSQVTGNQPCGVKIVGDYRTVDQGKIETRREIISDESYARSLTQSYQSLANLLGSMNEGNSLFDQVRTTLTQLDILASNPENIMEHTNFIREVSNLTKNLNEFSQSIQYQRSVQDQEISDSVTQVNKLLHEAKKVNDLLQKDPENPNLFNQRDNILKQISSHLNIKVNFNQNNTVEIFSPNGAYTLLSGSYMAPLSFTPTAHIQASHTMEKGLSDICIGGDLSKGISASINGGSIAAKLFMRDHKLVQTQDDLDAFAQKLMQAVNAELNKGTSIAPPSSLTAKHAVDSSAPFEATGSIRVAILQGKTMSHSKIIDLSSCTSFEQLVAALNDIPEISASENNGYLSIKCNDSSQSIAFSPAQDTPDDWGTILHNGESKSFVQTFGFNDLLQSGVKGPGLAGSITIDSNMSWVPSIGINPNSQEGDLTLRTGNIDPLQSLRESFTQSQQFTSLNGQAAKQETFGSYMQVFYTHLSHEAVHAENLHTFQERALDNTESLIQSLGGVDLKDALTQLQQWMQYLKANSAALSVSNKMIDSLLEQTR